MKKETPTNTFLQPIIDELIEAWYNGFFLMFRKSGKQFKNFRLALLSVGCDVPASRKLCGFYGHMANLSCNKCEKQFPGVLGKKKRLENLREACGLLDVMIIIGRYVEKFQNVLQRVRRRHWEKTWSQNIMFRFRLL